MHMIRWTLTLYLLSIYALTLLSHFTTPLHCTPYRVLEFGHLLVIQKCIYKLFIMKQLVDSLIIPLKIRQMQVE